MTKCTGGVVPDWEICQVCGATSDDPCKFDLVEFATMREANITRQREWDAGGQVDNSYHAYPVETHKR